MVAYLIVAAIWIYVILFAVIGATVFDDGDNRYITPEPYWCWIGSRHTGAQLAGEYVWMWLCALVSLILYVPLCFCLGGYIEADRGRWWAIRIGRAKNPSAGEPDIRIEKPRPGKEAFVMLLYPISYVILVLPDSICRWMQFRNQTVPSAGVFFSTSIFGLSGLANVVLLMYTRPGLLLLNEPATRRASEARLWGPFADRSPTRS
ncbi:hypothetical protein JB92DRAFT_2914550, partial [Gautieria morchelliformis]